MRFWRMITFRNIITINKDRCAGCGTCVEICSDYGFHATAIRIVDEKCTLINETRCYGRGDCIAVCPEDALFIEKREAELISRPVALGY